MLNFLSLGSGSSGNCYLLYTENDAIMIDVGIGIRSMKKYFREYGQQPSMVKHILVTHDHADHIKSVGTVSGDFDIEVFASKSVHAGIDRNYCVKRKIDAHRKRIINEGEFSFSVGDFSITAFHVPHDSSDNIGYCVECEGITFVLMTDVGHVTDEMKEMIGQANYLVLEANFDDVLLANGPYPEHLKRRITCGTGHLSNRKCAETIVECASEKLKRVWLCHLSAENNRPEVALETVLCTLKANGFDTENKVKVEVLNRTRPTGVYELKLY